MKIAITADPGLPVPPRLYGGIERIIDMLVRGLVDRGHSVTLFAHPESSAPAQLVPYATGLAGRAETLANLRIVTHHIRRGGFDLVHSFGRLAYLLPLLPTRLPKLMTYQREVTPSSARWGHLLSRGSLRFSAVSHSMIARVKRLGHWDVVYNGVPMDVYDFVPAVPPDAPLVFLGRVEHIKGPQLAVEIARRSGRRLVIAGNVPAGHEGFFEREIQPHLDGERVRYIGPVDDAAKNALLGGAAAFLMPILWEEPFGIVMAEALACGTPVLGLRRGAVPEVVAHGETGYVADTVDELVHAVGRLGGIERRRCRERAQAMFSDTAVVQAYLAVYAEMLRGQ